MNIKKLFKNLKKCFRTNFLSTFVNGYETDTLKFKIKSSTTKCIYPHNKDSYMYK